METSGANLDHLMSIWPWPLPITRARTLTLHLMTRWTGDLLRRTENHLSASLAITHTHTLMKIHSQWHSPPPRFTHTHTMRQAITHSSTCRDFHLDSVGDDFVYSVSFGWINSTGRYPVQLSRDNGKRQREDVWRKQKGEVKEISKWLSGGEKSRRGTPAGFALQFFAK